MKKPHPTKHSFDYITASLAAMALACLVVLGGCGPQNGETPVAASPAKATATAKAVPAAPRPVPSANLGEVRHIETLTERPKGTGVGAVAGGVLGGEVGHEIGDGNGQKVATAAGAIGGAVLGNKIERDRAVKVVGYRIDVRLDNGDTRSFQQPELAGLSVGDRVRVEGGALRPS